VVLGVLYAPASGKETRKKITGMENDLEDMVSKGKEKILQHNIILKKQCTPQEKK